MLRFFKISKHIKILFYSSNNNIPGTLYINQDFCQSKIMLLTFYEKKINLGNIKHFKVSQKVSFS
jgi:hypothetical protein